MKRLALVLAAVSVLGTGCFVASDPPSGSVDLAWRFIRVLPDGSTVAYGCATGDGVDSVVVTFGTGAGRQVPCQDNVGDGALISGVHAGTQTMVVTGRRAGVDIYSSQFNVAVQSGTTTPLDLDVYGIPDDLDILAELVTPTGGASYASCNAAGVSGFTYRVVDSAGTVMATGSLGCTTGLPGLSFRGNQALDRDTYTIRLQAPATGAVVFDSATTAVSPACSGQPFGHTGVDTGTNAWRPLVYDITGNGTVCR
jgi:hypothetical protein